MRMTLQEYANLQSKRKNAKPQKYHNTPNIIDDIFFRSKLEAECYQYCKLLQNNGEIEYFILQPRFELGGGAKHYSDFLLVPKGITLPILDAKGYETSTYRLKKKLVESKYPIKIEMWRKK